MKLKIGAILKTARPDAAGLKVYHELTPDLYSATSTTFIGRVYGHLGMVNIADDGRLLGVWLPAAVERIRRQVEP